MNIDKDYLKRLNLIIEKTKGYENVAFPVGTNGEFGALYISDLENVLSELETYKKIAEFLAGEYWIADGTFDGTFGNWSEVLDWAKREVSKDE